MASRLPVQRPVRSGVGVALGPGRHRQAFARSGSQPQQRGVEIEVIDRGLDQGVGRRAALPHQEVIARLGSLGGIKTPGKIWPETSTRPFSSTRPGSA